MRVAFAPIPTVEFGVVVSNSRAKVALMREVRPVCFVVLAAFVATTATLAAQETETEAEPRNTATVSMGRSRGEIEHGVEEVTSAIGADYMRRVKGRWELGVQVDVDFDRNGSGAEAFLVTPVVSYAITERWPVFLGAGVAFEEDHTLGFLRAGTEFAFPLDKKRRWFIAPGVFLDVGSEVTPSVMIALGHNF